MTGWMDGWAGWGPKMTENVCFSKECTTGAKETVFLRTAPKEPNKLFLASTTGAWETVFVRGRSWKSVHTWHTHTCKTNIHTHTHTGHTRKLTYIHTYIQDIHAGVHTPMYPHIPLQSKITSPIHTTGETLIFTLERRDNLMARALVVVQ